MTLFLSKLQESCPIAEVKAMMTDNGNINTYINIYIQENALKSHATIYSHACRQCRLECW